MLWVLLVYVVASNGYAGSPSVTSSFHGATFATNEACAAAARGVTLYTAPGTDDVAKSGLILVCAPMQPPPEPAPPPPPAAVVVPMQQSPFPPYPPYPPPPVKPSRH
jgi:hypothetical protein